MCGVALIVYLIIITLLRPSVKKKVKKKAVPISRNSSFPEVKEYEKYEEKLCYLETVAVIIAAKTIAIVSIVIVVVVVVIVIIIVIVVLVIVI